MWQVCSELVQGILLKHCLWKELHKTDFISACGIGYIHNGVEKAFFKNVECQSQPKRSENIWLGKLSVGQSDTVHLTEANLGRKVLWPWGLGVKDKAVLSCWAVPLQKTVSEQLGHRSGKGTFFGNQVTDLRGDTLVACFGFREPLCILLKDTPESSGAKWSCTVLRLWLLLKVGESCLHSIFFVCTSYDRRCRIRGV